MFSVSRQYQGNVTDVRIHTIQYLTGKFTETFEKRLNFESRCLICLLHLGLGRLSIMNKPGPVNSTCPTPQSYIIGR